MFGGVFGVSLVVIENGPHSSMWPTYDQGDMFLIYKSKPENIHLGDVVVYESATISSRGTLIIHRVVNITIFSTSNGDKYYFRVSGDNPDSNNHIDTYNSTTTLIPYDAIVGKTKLLIPKIGYIRLWMGTYPAVRWTVLLALVGIGLYLILAPDKKEEEKDEETKKETKETEKVVEVDKEKKRAKEVLLIFLNNSWEKTKIYFKELITVKEKRIKFIITISIIVFLIVAIPVIDTIIRSPGVTTEIDNVDLLITKSYTVPIEDIFYLPFTIYFKHDGSWNTQLKCFTVEGIQSGTTLAVMKWYSYYQVEGDNRIGGSLVFHVSEFDFNSTLTIKISYTISFRFGGDFPMVYENDFLPPFF
jgi:signal peptidase I